MKPRELDVYARYFSEQHRKELFADEKYPDSNVSYAAGVGEGEREERDGSKQQATRQVLGEEKGKSAYNKVSKGIAKKKKEMEQHELEKNMKSVARKLKGRKLHEYEWGEEALGIEKRKVHFQTKSHGKVKAFQ